MMKQALGTAAAAVFATAIAGAQAPAQQDHDRQSGQMVTVEGCLQHDGAGSAQVADAARDDDKKFMLVSAQVQSGTAASARPSESATDSAAQAETPVGTSGTAASAMKFKVSGLDDDRLTQYAGQRVQIQGTIEHSEHRGAASADRSSAAPRAEADRPAGEPGTAGTTGTTAAPDTGATGAAAAETRSASVAGDVPELKATSIQAASGSCPQAPESR